jgi:hypothetical protein
VIVLNDHSDILVPGHGVCLVGEPK